MVSKIVLAAVFVVTPKIIKEPTLRQKGPYVIENPLTEKVTVSLSCGDDYEQLKVDVEPKSTVSFSVETPGGKDLYGCFIESWRRVSSSKAPKKQ